MLLTGSPIFPGNGASTRMDKTFGSEGLEHGLEMQENAVAQR